MTEQHADPLPILYSFRRCPYAMRARLALHVSGQHCDLREIVLRNKPDEMIAASPKATVPVLVLPDRTVLDESFDIMVWALQRFDPESWLRPESGTEDEMTSMVASIDADFKTHLDRYKYASRYGGAVSDMGLDEEGHKSAALSALDPLVERLKGHPFLFGTRTSLADNAIAPFVRQFANVDRDWFSSIADTSLQSWLEAFEGSRRFSAIFRKYPLWKSTGQSTIFPE